jgi:hypothetical protein
MPNRPMLVAGSAIFLGAYVPSAIIAGYSSNPDDKALWAPVVGPWIDLATRDCSGSCTSPDTWNAIGLVASGVAQTAGLAIAIASFAVPSETSKTSSAATVRKQTGANGKVLVTPVSFRAGAGVGAVGTF